GRGVETRIREYPLDSEPVFCGRDEFFELFYQMLAPAADFTLLGVYTQDATTKLGKTRLLQELAAQALRDGHVPVMHFGVERTWEPGINHLGQLALKLLLALDEAYRIFQFDPPLDRELLDRLSGWHQLDRKCLEKYQADPRRHFAEWLAALRLLDRQQKLRADLDLLLLRSAVAHDLRALTLLARQRFKNPAARVVVFLDEVHRYGAAAEELVGK